ncbi:MAG: xylose isomerase, partial [Planctomycetota bacterium]
MQRREFLIGAAAAPLVAATSPAPCPTPSAPFARAFAPGPDSFAAWVPGGYEAQLRFAREAGFRAWHDDAL